VEELLVQVLSQIRSAWRFRWYGAAVAWFIALAGWMGLALVPDVYEGTATVYVDTSSILRPLLKTSIVPTDFVTQLQYVRQAVLGHEYLERVATANGLDQDLDTPKAKEKMLNRLRNSVRIDAASTSDAVDRTNTSSMLKITYRNETSATAVGVVRDLLNHLIEDTQSASRENTDAASTFLDERIREYENRLQQAEQSLADFQRKNAGRLPGSEGGYFERIQREREALDKTDREIRLAQSRRFQLEQQLNGETPVTIATSVAATEPAPNSIDARIRDSRAQLDKLLLVYTEQHPDIVALRATLDRLEKQRSDQLRALGIANPDQQITGLGANPVYQAVQIALNQVQVDIATLQADADDRRRRLKEYQGLVEDVPQVEAELQRLNRDYDDIRKQYQALVQSRETQMLSRKAAEADQVEFRVINPPTAGFGPVAPKRLLLIPGVLAAALGLGGALCFLLAQTKPVFSSARALTEISGLPVLGAVSRVLVSGQARRQQFFALVNFSAAIAGLVLVFGVVVSLEVAGYGLRTILVGA
jgi:polysaccharide chain length determinant protein (PEP-CTERM system associated)